MNYYLDFGAPAPYNREHMFRKHFTNVMTSNIFLTTQANPFKCERAKEKQATNHGNLSNIYIVECKVRARDQE